MRLPRFGISWLMAVVAYSALNLVVLRAVLARDESLTNLLLTGGLPMANALVIGLVIGYFRPRSRPFIRGFEYFGAMALGLLIPVTSRMENIARVDYFLIVGGQEVGFGLDPRKLSFTPGYFLFAIMLLVPQLILAAFGGLLTHWFGRTRPKIAPKNEVV